MKLIIDIADDQYKAVQDGMWCGSLYEELKNGIPVEQCGDCIRRSDIGLTDFEIVMCNGDYKEGLKMLLDKIEKATSVSPMPKMGQWFVDERPESNREIICSNCEKPVFRYHKIDFDYRPNYCPNCGAKMQEVRNV